MSELLFFLGLYCDCTSCPEEIFLGSLIRYSARCFRLWTSMQDRLDQTPLTANFLR